MRLAVMLLVGFVAVFPVVSERAFAQKQKKPASIAPAEPLKPGWEEIDKRLVFLMVRLANVEASLDAVEKRVGAGARQRAAKAGEAKRAEKGNEMMDRKGGGPVKWSQFYGRTAEKFFYHPVDRNTSYHTTTVLSQKSPQADNQSGEGVPSRQGLPVHQRPPQFDYIYKANQDAQARAERDAAQLRDKIDALQARRRQLEDEQSALWCQIAFRAVSRHDLARKPLYRFEPIPGAGDTESRQQAEATKAAAIFMRRALSIVEEAEKDQAKAFGSIKLVVADAHSKFDDGLLPLDTLAKDTTDLKTAIGRFSALARRLKDVADNLSDSYEVAVDGDRFKDELRKDTFRGLLQESLVDYAEVVLALNEMGQVLESEWKTKPDVNTPLQFVSLEMPERVVRPAAPDVSPDDSPAPVNVPVPRSEKWISLFDGRSLAGWKPPTGNQIRGWSARNGELVLTPIRGSTSLVSTSTFDDFELKCEFWLDVRTNSGIYLRGRYELQLLDDPTFPQVKNEQRCGAIYGLIAPSRSAYRGPKQWNSLLVRLEGKNVTVVLNGTTAIDNQFISQPTPAAYDSREGQPGPILLQNHGTAVSFRKVEIRRLNSERSDEPKAPAEARSTSSTGGLETTEIPSDQDVRISAELSKLNGTWRFVSGEGDGRPFLLETTTNRTMTFSGTQYTLSFGDRKIEGTITIDPSVSPHRLDFTALRGGHPDFAGYPQPGIYELEGDRLTIVVSAPRNSPRPVRFTSEGQGVSLQVYQRRDSAETAPEEARPKQTGQVPFQAVEISIDENGQCKLEVDSRLNAPARTTDCTGIEAGTPDTPQVVQLPNGHRRIICDFARLKSVEPFIPATFPGGDRTAQEELKDRMRGQLSIDSDSNACLLAPARADGRVGFDLNLPMNTKRPLTLRVEFVQLEQGRFTIPIGLGSANFVCITLDQGLHRGQFGIVRAEWRDRRETGNSPVHLERPDGWKTLVQYKQEPEALTEKTFRIPAASMRNLDPQKTASIYLGILGHQPVRIRRVEVTGPSFR